jgi:DNA-binding PadR family transcriptional regulator
MSGYDLKGFADRSIRHFFWAPAKSQVYSELRRLTAIGYVEQREVEQETRPDKRVYSITREGRVALTAWLESSPPGSEIVKSTTVLRTFLGEHMSPATLAQGIERYGERMGAWHEELEGWLESHEPSPSDFFPRLTIRWGLAYTAASMEWAKEAAREIESSMAKNAIGPEKGIGR